MTTLNFTTAKCIELPAQGVYRIIKCAYEGKTYILKCLKPAYADKRAYRLLLKREYEAVKRIDNPCLPNVHALLDESPYGPCIVEEYVDGRSLTAYIAERHTTAELEAVARQIMDGLRAIHAHCLQHRNLKPSNVLITRQGDQVRLIDLWPAYADEIQVLRVSTRYLAPEQKDETVAIDARADIFALGMLMRDMGLSDVFGRVIDRACSMGRSDRYIDIDAMEQAIDGGSSGRGRRLLLWAAGILVVVIIGVGGYALLGNGASDNAPSAVVTDTEAVAPDTLTRQTDTDVAATSTIQVDIESVRRTLQARLDAIYSPCLTADTLQAETRKAMRKQVKGYYKELIQTLGTMTQAERDAVDQAFGDYVKQKNAQLPPL